MTKHQLICSKREKYIYIKREREIDSERGKDRERKNLGRNNGILLGIYPLKNDVRIYSILLGI